MTSTLMLYEVRLDGLTCRTFGGVRSAMSSAIELAVEQWFGKGHAVQFEVVALVPEVRGRPGFRKLLTGVVGVPRESDRVGSAGADQSGGRYREEGRRRWNAPARDQQRKP